MRALWSDRQNCSHNESQKLNVTTELSGTSVWRSQSRYTVSRIECRIKFPQNQRCRAKIALHPPKSRCRTFLWTPLSHFPLILGHPQTRHETPTRHETTYFAQSTPWPRTQRNLWCSADFKAMNFNAPSITNINPT